jgi:Uma2 family endonuclease
MTDHPPQRPRYRITVAEYHRMIDAGILTEYHPIELIHGELLVKPPKGARHSACVTRMNRLFYSRFGDAIIVSVHNPVVLDDSEPEPDVKLIRFRPDFYRSGKPRPADVFLVIEVADSSFEFDRDVKGPLYAVNGIPEYWLVNLNDNSVTVYRQPQAGRYAAERRCTSSDVLDLLALPGVTLTVADILG